MRITRKTIGKIIKRLNKRMLLIPAFIILFGILLFYLFNRFVIFHTPTAGSPKTVKESGYTVSSQDLLSIPYLEIPAKIQKGNTLVLLYSGDGGWGSTEQPLSRELAGLGIPVIGVNATLYFFNPLTPAKTALDAENLLRYYLTVWNKKEIILIGYSYGADISPFILNRLSPDLSSKVKALVLMGPGKTIEFSIRGNGLLGIKGLPTYSVQSEVTKIKNTKIICFYGVGEKDTLCPDLPHQQNIVTLTHNGGHRIDTNYNDLLKELHIIQ